MRERIWEGNEVAQIVQHPLSTIASTNNPTLSGTTRTPRGFSANCAGRYDIGSVHPSFGWRFSTFLVLRHARSIYALGANTILRVVVYTRPPSERFPTTILTLVRAFICVNSAMAVQLEQFVESRATLGAYEGSMLDCFVIHADESWGWSLVDEFGAESNIRLNRTGAKWRDCRNLNDRAVQTACQQSGTTWNGKKRLGKCEIHMRVQRWILTCRCCMDRCSISSQFWSRFVV